VIYSFRESPLSTKYYLILEQRNEAIAKIAS
jgi:hypothetical protein